MKMKANDLFEGYLHKICPSQAQFEAINKLHKLYFESQMDAEVDIEDGKGGEGGNCECNDGNCECKDGICECDNGLNEAVVGEEVNIDEEAEKNGLTVPEYKRAEELFYEEF